jgi:hypothetical protein
MGAVVMMDSLLYKILKNRTGAEISASGNPATLPGTLKNNPMNEMKVYGWSKQETTKGKNLFDFSRLVSDGVNVMDYDNQTITIPARTNNTGYNQTLRDLCPGITPGTYVFSAKKSNPESGNGSYFLEAGLDFTFNTPTELTDALLDNHIAWYNNEDSEVENVISEIQIEIGTEATDYEPYTGGQPSPSPDYPQQIVSAGDGGEVEVTICGKNLFDGNTDISKTQCYKLPIQMRKGAKLTMSFVGVGTGSGAAKAYCHDSELNFCNTLFYFDVKSGVNKYSSTITCSGREKNIFFYKTEFTKFFENMYDIQIEINGIATDYKPYYTPQSLSISTPTGLPAIPVDTDGNYTDADGQQWIADYVDLKRGKYVQNVTAFELTGDEKFRYESGSNTQNISDGLYTVGFALNDTINKMVISNAFVQATNNWTPEIIYVKEKKVSVFTLTNAHWIFFVLDATTFPTKEDFVLFLKAKKDAGNPVVLYYNLSEPIERNLTQSEIQAYQNLVTYAGTTIVENDAECYMEVSAGGGNILRAKKLALILGD